MKEKSIKMEPQMAQVLDLANEELNAANTNMFKILKNI